MTTLIAWIADTLDLRVWDVREFIRWWLLPGICGAAAVIAYRVLGRNAPSARVLQILVAVVAACALIVLIAPGPLNFDASERLSAKDHLLRPLFWLVAYSPGVYAGAYLGALLVGVRSFFRFALLGLIGGVALTVASFFFAASVGCAAGLGCL